MYTPYSKIETLYERNTERIEGGLLPGKLLPELKLKNPLYGEIKEWVFTEKIDGTNMRVEWNPTGEADGGTPICGDFGGVTPPGTLIIGGKTDKAQINGALMARMNALFNPEALREIFPDTAVTFYGEGYGAGIQKIGGSYKTEKDFIGFDIFVHADLLVNPFGGFWLSDENMREVYANLGVSVVPLVAVAPLQWATEYVCKGFKSSIGIADAEGLVGRTVLPLFDGRGHRLITKIKTVDFDASVNYLKPHTTRIVDTAPFEN